MNQDHLVTTRRGGSLARFAWQLVALALLLGGPLAAPAGQDLAAEDLYVFADDTKKARFWALAKELRCLVCQNQSVAESNADLAKDIRNELFKQINTGAADKEIIEWMVARYGEFVLFRPRLKTSTIALWGGPFVLGIGGLYLLVRLIRRVETSPEAEELSEEERAKLEALLQQNSEKQAS